MVGLLAWCSLSVSDLRYAAKVADAFSGPHLSSGIDPIDPGPRRDRSASSDVVESDPALLRRFSLVDPALPLRATRPAAGVAVGGSHVDHCVVQEVHGD